MWFSFDISSFSLHLIRQVQCSIDEVATVPCTLLFIKSSCTLFDLDFFILFIPSYDLLCCLLGELDVKWKAGHLCLCRWQRRDTRGCYQWCSPLPGQGGQGLPETREGKSSGWVAVFHLLRIPRISSVKKGHDCQLFHVPTTYHHCLTVLSALRGRAWTGGIPPNTHSFTVCPKCETDLWRNIVVACVFLFSQCKDTSRDLLRVFVAFIYLTNSTEVFSVFQSCGFLLPCVKY